MKRAIDFIVTVEVDNERGEPLDLNEARAEARRFLDTMLGTYVGSSRWERSNVASAAGRSWAKAVKFRR